ncbi:hypothetical protein FACS1894109_02560 [Spirochaetia bacterium]|nr:hypothetical protein FACS1894109_02560 [Spirochaetia bacterium]
MQENGTQTENNLLTHISRIVTLSNKQGLSKDFFAEAEEHLNAVCEKLQVTPVQAVLFSHYLGDYGDYSITSADIAEAIHCDKIEMIRYLDDIDCLEQKRLIYRCQEEGSFFERRRKGKEGAVYGVPADVVAAIRQNRGYEVPGMENLSLPKLFEFFDELFARRKDDEVSFDNFIAEIRSLFDLNHTLGFVQKITGFRLSNEDLALLLFFCSQLVNDDEDSVSSREFHQVYERRAMVNSIKRTLKDGTNPLIRFELIENEYRDGLGDTECFRLTEKAKTELFTEINMPAQQAKSRKGLIEYKSIAKKTLFYNEREAAAIRRLTGLLHSTQFNKVRTRLAKSGMRTGFACLFSGAPGTGKTETVYQIARATKRAICMVNIAQTKSKWFGESEQKIKGIFDRYRMMVQESVRFKQPAPILLFNEADAVIGKRRRLEDERNGPGQTENAIQNIILQEMENLDGILIATTNLTNNMDSAFERRFLYKIEFEKPCQAAREAIWKTMLPGLSAEEVGELAARYDFSGGQIENISRKRAVDAVLGGEEPSFDMMLTYCNEEHVGKQAVRIGFGM